MGSAEPDRSAPHLSIALPSGGSDTDGARALLRERLSLWAKWVFFLSGSFYVVTAVTTPWIAEVRRVDLMLNSGALLHLAGALWFAAIALIARHPSLSTAALRFLDVAALVVGCAIFAWMAPHLHFIEATLGDDSGMGLYAGVLACVHTIVARGIVVPSTATRTFWASTLASLPLLPAVYETTGMVALVVNVACWAAVAIAVATLGSRIIFGLRTEAARARRLGQYMLEERIGAGGMGIVYRARHAMLRRPTAVKLLPPDRAGEANLQRFEREVQLTSELSHPNTITIYDYGRTPEGIFYYAMEYLDGITLDELVRTGGPVSAGRTIAILSQVCRALAEAHGRGLLHRDIKPANIFLTERGGEPDVVKVLDFGLVKPISGGAPDVTMSSAIVLAGTPLYMPPEAVFEPQHGDVRSDLYGVGAVGYFLLTGRPVFEAATITEIFAMHLQHAPVPPSQHVSSVPADLEAVIMRCLSKAPADRPPDARTLERELKRCAAAAAWSRDDAALWWQRFRRTDRTSPAAGIRPDEALTVTVDLAARVPAP
jgi:eukaryotic-like serine/threonine-protein kinase